MDLNVYDLYGNNAAIACPSCNEPYIVTTWNEEKKGARPCPHCGERPGIRFADVQSVYKTATSGEPTLERVTRLYFSRHWVGTNRWCLFTAADGTIYKYDHDAVLEQLAAAGGNLKNTKSWIGRGIYHFPQLSISQRAILEPYIIGKESIDIRVEVGSILRFLNQKKTRCTYGAIADALGVNVMKVAGLLGRRRPEASWVVNKTTLRPTGYEPDEEHSSLYDSDTVITSGAELMAAMEQ
ncbi:hypothetical protein R0135_14110 [Congregibacter variabilis]|uniref:Uncharacterized protein n=1 Tax=Congregibacter variabilis TaxID=3081200 RepID=A0ABZ0I1H7_9GAMM|nr:hypothetical protein R0135_14110 [Congregibacter sp. IMCC43200]